MRSSTLLPFTPPRALAALTPEEQAESGELGEDMATLVAKIRDGEDTWEQVFSGESPHAALLQGHLTRMFEEHKDDIALAFEELIEAEEATGNFIFDEVPTSGPELQSCSS